jgi:lysylphosphatidylglycerol synthetase-like protein (DUF2156 family)
MNFDGFIDPLIPAVWPALVAVACLAIVVRQTVGFASAMPRAMLSAAAVLVAFLVFVLVYSFHHTTMALANGYIFAIVLGLVMIFVRMNDQTSIRRILIRVFGAVTLTYGCWNLVGDFLLRRTQVEGVVSHVEQGRSPSWNRSAWRYHIELSGRRFETTKVLFERVERGQRIRADVGKGSGMILAAEQLPF